MQNSQNMPKAYVLMKSESNKIQMSSGIAAKEICSVIKTCLGPRAMQKMVITKQNSVELTNDGNTILRELDVSHPSARCLIDLSQTQDDECGDGTTSVMILASEMLHYLAPLVKDNHPIRVSKILSRFKTLSLNALDKVSVDFNESDLLKIVNGSISTKLCSMLKLPFAEIAIKAIEYIKEDLSTPADENENENDLCNNSRNINNKKISINIKHDIKVIKLIGDFKKCNVIDGVIINKEIFHPNMRKSIKNPKIFLLDFPFEYIKGESATNLEFREKEDVTELLKIEEQQISLLVDKVASFGPDIVITEKGMCDLALGLFASKNITGLRRFKKSDSLHVAKASGATIISRPEDLEESHLGTKVGQFDFVNLGKDNYCMFHKCKDPKAVSVIISGPSTDIINELERNFTDAIKVAKNILLNPKMVPGGGASEFEMISALKNSYKNFNLLEKEICDLVIKAFESIPSILAKNSGAINTIELLHNLLIEHKNGNSYTGINGITGELCDVRSVIMDPIIVKKQCVKSSFDLVIQLLRVDGIIECFSLKK